MSYPGSRVALLHFRNTEITPKQPLQKVCWNEVWITEGFRACCVYTSSSTAWRRPPEAGRKGGNVQKVENLGSVGKSRLQKFDCTTMTKLTEAEAMIQVWHPGLRSRRWNVWLQLRPFQNFRLRLLNTKWMKFGGQEFCSN